MEKNIEEKLEVSLNTNSARTGQERFAAAGASHATRRRELDEIPGKILVRLTALARLEEELQVIAVKRFTSCVRELTQNGGINCVIFMQEYGRRWLISITE